MSAQPTRQDPLLGEVRFRLPLPVILPIGSLIVIALIAVAFSQILLNVPKEVATVIALATAANLLVALSVIATRPQMSRARILEVLAVMLYPIIIGAGLAIVGIGEGTSGGEHQTGGPAAGGIVVSAANVQFDTDQIALPADQETTISFNNEDSADHNISIYEDDSAQQDLFKGATVSPGDSTEYQVPAIPEGEYYFQCDIHPAMNGDVTVAAEGEPAEGEGEPAEGEGETAS
jgi:plastocyanin